MKQYLVHVAVYVQVDVDLTEELLKEAFKSLPFTIEYRYHEEV